MGDILQQVRDKLQREFEPTHFVLEDLSGGCGTSLSVVVVSTKFDGVPLLERHRMVNTCLQEELKSIHALSIKAWTPAQFAARSAK